LAFLGVLSALLLTFGTVQARRSTFVQAIIITASATPAPTGDAKWQQVPDRGKVDRVLQHPTPSFRNLWLPVRFDDGLFAADTMSVVRYYRNMGFLDARIVASAKEPVSTATGGMQYVNLLIVVGGISPLERYRVSSLSFSGKMSLDSVALGKAFRNRHTGGYFSPAAMAENYVALRTAYADAGYFDSSAVAIRQRPIIDLERRTVSERYEIQERTPTSVSGVRIINGDAPRSLKTDSAVIVQALSDAHLVDGEVFGRQRILNAESYLFDLGVFRRARAFPDTGYVGGSPFLRRVAVDLSERDAGEARIQMGYSNIQRWRLSETMTYSNFLGEAKLVGQEGQLAQDIQSFSLLYGQPRVGFPSFTPGIGGKSARVRFDQVLSSSWEVLAAGDTARTLAWKAGLSRRFGRMARVGFSYDLSRTDTTASYVFGLSRGGATVQSALSVSVLYDTRDEFLNPTRGFAFNAQVRFVNPNYRVTRMSVRPEALVVYFYPYSRFVVGAVSASGGFYYVGKEDSLNQAEQFWRSRQTPTARGIPRDDLTVIRGDTVGNPAVAYALIKAETRIAIWKRLSSAVFVDAGQAWVWIPRAVTDPTAEERSSRGWSAMEAGKFGLSAGFGPRVDWGLLFRLDIVRQITPSSNWTYEFGITQAF
jgi:outer membrane protein assembly factor BamA